MYNCRYFTILIYILTLLSIIFCQFDNESLTKALACMSIIGQKFKGDEPDPSVYSTMMLKCFISISESQSKKIIAGIESGQNIISKKDIDKLTDYESLKDMSQNELRKKSYELEKTLKHFKKMQDEISGRGGEIDPDDYDEDYDDEGFSQERPANINFFSLIPKGVSGLFNVFNSYISLFLVFAIVYFGLLMLRKINDSEKKMKSKKKPKIEEDYEEEEEEEYEEIDEKNKKNGKEKKS